MTPPPNTQREWQGSGPYADFVRDVRHVPTSPFAVIEATKPAGAYPDPAMAELVLIEVMRGSGAARCDYGAGSFSTAVTPGMLLLVPPQAASVAHIERAFTVRFFSIQAAHLRHLDPDAAEHSLDFGKLHTLSFRSGFITALLSRLWDCANDETPMARLFVDSAMLTLVSALRLESPSGKRAGASRPGNSSEAARPWRRASTPISVSPSSPRSQAARRRISAARSSNRRASPRFIG